jgi:hypothetical protein
VKLALGRFNPNQNQNQRAMATATAVVVRLQLQLMWRSHELKRSPWGRCHALNSQWREGQVILGQSGSGRH